MRFFKYLVFILLSLISITSYSGDLYYLESYPSQKFSTPLSACENYRKIDDRAKEWDVNNSALPSRCQYWGGTWMTDFEIKKVTNNCPKQNQLYVAWLPKGTTSIPLRMCIDGCTYEGSGRLTETPNYSNTTLFATGDTANCSNLNTDSPPPKCDTTDPYGDCFVPPDDNCVRLKDGSITCPNNQPPPIKQGCNAGETYCVRPPGGCGTGYVSGSFNGQELCVKSGPSTPPVKPNDPNDPENPNKCATSYCPKPDDNKDCPSGYYQTTHNGESICVKNNPNPNNPNPNDPNNNDNGSGSSEPNGGDGTGTGSGKIDLKPIIDAIKALKDSLLSSLDSISKKMTTLIDAQKKTNETLEKSDKHLENIEKSSQAASEAIGETNKKLDKIFSDEGKEQIEQLGEQSTDSRLTAAETEMTSKLQQFANTLSYSSSHACISDFTVTNIPHFGSMTVPLSKWCDLLALVKLLLKLAVLMLALKMIDATVRAF